MANTTIQLLHAILDGWWDLMTGWKIPGINVTPAQLTFFMAVAPLTIKFIKDLISLSVHNMNSGSTYKSRGGSRN